MLLIAVLVLPAISCNNNLAGEGENVTEVRNLDVFDSIELETDAEVLLTQGPSQEVRVEAQRNILDVLTTEVSRGRLQIGASKNLGEHNPIRLHITMPNVAALIVNGSGAINGQNMMSVNDMRLEVDGSGDITLHVIAQNLQSIVDGSGDMNLQGRTNGLVVNVAGSGNVRAFDLTADRAEVVVNGSGDCEVTAQNALKAVVNGSGDVRYRGEPADKQFSMQGSGEIMKAD